MNTAPPYRTPCGGFGPLNTTGIGCYQHKKKAEEDITIMSNVTTVDTSTPVQGTAGPPDSCSATRKPDRAIDGNCYAPPPIGTASGATTNTTGYDLGATIINLAAAGTGPIHPLNRIQFADDPNWYLVATGCGDVSTAGGHVHLFPPGLKQAMTPAAHAITLAAGKWDYSTCHKTGWKAVRADKTHHGSLPYDSCTCPQSATRYLHERRAISGSCTLTTYPYYKFNLSIIREAEVDKDTGIISLTDCTDGWTLDSETAEVEGYPRENYVMPWWPGWIGTPLACGNFVNVGWGEDQGLNTPSSPAGQLVLWATFAHNMPTGWRMGGRWVHATEFSVTITGVAEEGVETGWLGSLTFSGDLTDEYSVADCYADAVALLDYYPLTNDMVLPWRTDDLCARVPVVRRNEDATASPTDAMTGWGTCATWEDSSDFDGRILGIPNPPGYGINLPGQEQGHYAFGLLWDPASAATPGCWTPSGIPLAATWWSNAPDDGTSSASTASGGANYPPGAYSLMGRMTGGTFVYDGIMHVQKWAITKEADPSMNFFRPCGEDRMMVKEGEWECVSSVSLPTLTLFGTPTTPWPSGTLLGIAGVAGLADGVYTVSSQTGSTVVLQGAPDLKWSYGGYFNTEGGGWVAPIRWPTAWPICGRCDVSTVDLADSNTHLQFTLSTAAPWLRVGDLVDFVTYDTSFTPTVVLGSQTVVEIVSDTAFKVAGTSVPTVTGWYVISHGAPHYKWHDADPKGDFTLRAWTLNACDNTFDFACTPHCLRRTPCEPSVICFSPNESDVFPNGQTYGMGAPAHPNQIREWIAVPGIIDPLWQQPHGQCGGTDFTTECLGIHPPPLCAPPWVESLCAIPDGAPDMPAGILLPCPDYLPDPTKCQPLVPPGPGGSCAQLEVGI